MSDSVFSGFYLYSLVYKARLGFQEDSHGILLGFHCDYGIPKGLWDSIWIIQKKVSDYIGII